MSSYLFRGFEDLNSKYKQSPSFWTQTSKLNAVLRIIPVNVFQVGVQVAYATKRIPRSTLAVGKRTWKWPLLDRISITGGEVIILVLGDWEWPLSARTEGSRSHELQMDNWVSIQSGFGGKDFPAFCCTTLEGFCHFARCQVFVVGYSAGELSLATDIGTYEVLFPSMGRLMMPESRGVMKSSLAYRPQLVSSFSEELCQRA